MYIGFRSWRGLFFVGMVDFDVDLLEKEKIIWHIDWRRGKVRLWFVLARIDAQNCVYPIRD
jgi:hypothetical protein